MDWVEITLALLKIFVSWPVAAVVVAYLLREPFKKLLEKARLEELELGPGGVKAKLGRLEEKIEKLPPQEVPSLLPTATHVPSTPDTPTVPTTTAAEPETPPPPPELTATGPRPVPVPEDVELDLLLHAPQGAVLAGWAGLEALIKSTALRFLPTASSELSLVRSLELLKNNNVIGPVIIDSIHGLRQIRNSVAHGAQVEATDVARFLEIRNEVTDYIMAGADLIQLKELLKILKVETAMKVTVAPLLAYGVSASEEVAREMARTRRGKWSARAGGISTMITEDDAKMLIRFGAKYSDKPSAG